MKFLIGVIAVLTIACGDTKIYNGPTSPSGTPVGNTTNFKNTIEFRVTGNATSARIRFSTPSDGLSQTTSTLPYVIQVTTTQPSMFLSLEAIPLSYQFNIVYPYMSVQIFVNSVLFRESNSNELLLNPVSVSGTWRANSLYSPMNSDIE